MKSFLCGILVIMSVLVPNILLAQGDIIGKTEKLLGKGKYEKARQYVAKSIKKDSTSAYQALAVYYLHPQHYNTDSALLYNTNAMTQLDSLTSKQLLRIAKFGISKNYLLLFKQKIDSQAYFDAKKIHKLQHYQHYIDVHNTSLYLDSAVFYRDELAFDIALKTNTYQSYKAFIDQYPDAIQVPEARERFELLFYQKSVKKNNLQSFVNYLAEHPSSKFRPQAEWQILQLSTLTNSAKNFYHFARQYPNSSHAKVALDYAYHIDKEINKVSDINRIYYDSLQSAHTFSVMTVFPIYNNGFGFIDTLGHTVVPISYSSERVDSEFMYFGKNFAWLKDSIKSSLISKEGKVFFRGQLDEVKELGKGLVMYESKSKKGMLHISGYKVLPPKYDDIMLINDQFVAYKESEHWGICSSLGKRLLSPQYDNIESSGAFIILTKGEKYSIINPKQLQKSVSRKMNPEFVYDDFEYLGENKIIGYKDRYVELLDNNLINLLPTQTIDIQKINKHFICRTPKGYFVVNYTTLNADCSSEQLIIGNKAGIFINKNSQWYSYAHTQNPIDADSIYLLGDNFLKIYSKKGLAFTHHYTEHFPIDISYQLTRYKDEEYLIASNKNGIKNIIDSKGKTITLRQWDKVQAIGDSLWLVQRGRRKGIVDYPKNKVTNIRFDAIKRLNDNTLTLLKGQKFGAYLLKQRRIIGTKYDKQLVRYNDNLYVASLGGMVGLIDLRGKTILPHKFDQIHYWNDTSAIVKQGYQWLIYNINENQPIIQDIAQYENITPKNSESITLKIFQKNAYGIINSKTGIVLPSTFYNIYPINSDGVTLYVAEKYIEEADFYVVIYYDSIGKIVFKHAMKSEHYQQVKSNK